MRLATVETGGRRTCAAVRDDGRMVDLAPVDPAAGDMISLIAGWETLGPKVAAHVAGAAPMPEGARMLAPIPQPRKNVFCVGRNYAEHIAEGARAQNITLTATEVPVFFTKPPTAVVGPEDNALIFPRLSGKFDYEVELAVIIGKPGRDIPKDRAMEHVFGYTILNDVTARDVQRRHGGQWFKGKGLDGSGPTGPWIVTADTLPGVADTGIRLSVNGEPRQEGRTSAMIFDIPTLIASLSEGLTLEPGDIIATGTPSGVGYAMEPPRFLADGDTITCEIDGIGRLTNVVRAV